MLGTKFYIHHNDKIYGAFVSEEAAVLFGKTLAQDEWSDNKLIKVELMKPLEPETIVGIIKALRQKLFSE